VGGLSSSKSMGEPRLKLKMSREDPEPDGNVEAGCTRDELACDCVCAGLTTVCRLMFDVDWKGQVSDGGTQK
jgi:hypothetical protein